MGIAVKARVLSVAVSTSILFSVHLNAVTPLGGHIKMISWAEGEITLSASMDYSSSVSPSNPQPFSMVQYSSEHRCVFRADNDGEMTSAMVGQGTAYVAVHLTPLIPGAKLYSTGLSIELTNGEYTNSVQQVSVPLAKGNIYSIELISGMSDSGGVQSQHRHKDFTVSFLVDYLFE